MDEQIKRSDGQLVTRQKEAEAYCHRRNAEIQEMLLALSGETVAYSGADLEGISRQLANRHGDAPSNLEPLNTRDTPTEEPAEL